LRKHPAPPANVNTKIVADPTGGKTLRQVLESHAQNPACAVCHSAMDPIGFGLENYNAIGAYRTMDGTLPVDSAGSFRAVRSSAVWWSWPRSSAATRPLQSAWRRSSTRTLSSRARAVGSESHGCSRARRRIERLCNEGSQVSRSRRRDRLEPNIPEPPRGWRLT